MLQSQKTSSPEGSQSEPNGARKWVVVGLSATAEHDVNLQILAKSVHRILGRRDLEVFIPAVSRDIRSDSQIFVYMDGYLFVEYNPDVNYMKLSDTTYFSDVLCNSSRKTGPIYSLLDDSELDPVREGLESVGDTELSVNDRVRVTRGENKNLTGTVCAIQDDGQILISTGLRSKPLILPYPSSFLEKVEIKKK